MAYPQSRYYDSQSASTNNNDGIKTKTLSFKYIISYIYFSYIITVIDAAGRVQIRVYRGPNNEHENFAPWGYYVRQPADSSHNNNY